MTDPFKYIRERANLDIDIDRLLTDADALLEAVREELLMLRKHHYEGGDFRSFAEWLAKNRPNFAALPKHLRGDPNERSRKA